MTSLHYVPAFYVNIQFYVKSIGKKKVYVICILI